MKENRIAREIASFLLNNNYFEELPQKLRETLTPNQIMIRGLEQLPDEVLYYACGVYPSEFLKNFRLEAQTIYRQRAWEYAQDLDYEDLSPTARAIWIRLKRLNQKPQNWISSDFGASQMEQLEFSFETQMACVPKMNEIINELLKNDRDKDFLAATYFLPETFKTVDSFQQAIRLWANHMDCFSPHPCLLHFPKIPHKSVFVDTTQRLFHRMETAINILTDFRQDNDVISNIYNDFSMACKYLYLRQAKALKEMPVPKSHLEMKKSIVKMADFYVNLTENSDVTDMEIESEVSRNILNTRYVLDKTSNGLRRQKLLDWFDKAVDLTFEEKARYVHWEQYRETANLPCFHPSDGLMADENTALSEDEKALYKKQLLDEWDRWGLNFISDSKKDKKTNLPIMEKRLGHIADDVSDLALAYFMGILSTRQNDICIQEEEAIQNDGLDVSCENLSTFVSWFKTRPFPLDVPWSEDVFRVTNKLRSAIALYNYRFCCHPEDNTIHLGENILINHFGGIGSVYNDPILSEWRALNGFDTLLNTLDPQKETNLHHLLDCMVRCYYGNAVEGIRLLSDQMPKRHQSQIEVGLLILEKFKDPNYIQYEKHIDNKAMIVGIRNLICKKFDGNLKKRNAVLDEFNTWVQPWEIYWENGRQIGTQSVKTRNENNPSDGDREHE